MNNQSDQSVSNNESAPAAVTHFPKVKDLPGSTIEKLKGIFGAENVSTEEIDLLSYSLDASGITGSALAVVWPTEAIQLQRLMQYAPRAKLNLVPRGAGTGLAGAAVPDNSVVIDMSKMNNVLKIDPSKKEVKTEPGVVLSDLNDELDRYDLWFPVIPASYTACQVGGAASTNASGMRAIKYGNMCDWVKSMQVVDGTGKLLSIKKPSEICGTEGTLGIITELTLKVTEPVESLSLTTKTFDDLDKMVNYAQEFIGNPNVCSIEFFDKHGAKLGGLDPKYHVFIEYESDEGEVTDPVRIEALMDLRKSLGPKLTAKGYAIMEDPKIPKDKMKTFVRWLFNNKIPVFGHIGDGILHPRFKPKQEKLIEQMFDEVKKLGGITTGEHGIGITKKKFVSKEFVNQLKEKKTKYDPEGLLNRGKIYD